MYQTYFDGWSKSLNGIPNFTVSNIRGYHGPVNNTFFKNLTAIKKYVIRGDQFIDSTDIYIKQGESIFCLKELSCC